MFEIIIVIYITIWMFACQVATMIYHDLAASRLMLPK